MEIIELHGTNSEFGLLLFIVKVRLYPKSVSQTLGTS
jgi:hypothetical protein